MLDGREARLYSVTTRLTFLSVFINGQILIFILSWSNWLGFDGRFEQEERRTPALTCCEITQVQTRERRSRRKHD